MKSVLWLFIFALAVCQGGLQVGGSASLPEQTRSRIKLMVQRQVRDFSVSIPEAMIEGISDILSSSVAVNHRVISSTILEFCNRGVEKVLETLRGVLPDEFVRNMCYNVIVNHLQLVVNRQHFAENIYEASSKSICDSPNDSSPLSRFKGGECSISLETSMDEERRGGAGRMVVTPELAYLIADLIPLNPTPEDCVVAFMRVMALPFGLEREKAEKLCRSVLDLRKSLFFYRNDVSRPREAPSLYHEISRSPSRLAPFKRAPPFVEISHPHGVGGIMYSSERVSGAKDSTQGFGKLASLPFVNSPVLSIGHSESCLQYSQDHSKLSKEEIPKLNGKEEMVFNDDIFSDLIFPCKTLNYEAKILASLLYYYSSLSKVPITTEDACIACMRSVLVPAISIPTTPPKEKKKGISPNEVINPFIPTCVNALMTMSLFSPASKLSLEYTPSLKTSENAAKAFGKLCSKTMSTYIKIFGMIGIGNHSISCNPAQILLINSLQISIWTRFNALFASNELAQVACRVNLDSHASQASGECINLMKKITTGMAEDDIKAICQSTVKYLQPQPLVVNPILFTISSVFQAVTEAVATHHKNPGSLHISNFVKLAKKILHFSRPKMNQQEYINSCKALLPKNTNLKLTSKEIYIICDATSKTIMSVVMHYHIPLELQLLHKKQFYPRTTFIKNTIEKYSNLVKKEFSLHNNQ
ncbi:putative signal peptide-containing protein [Cryptosporidium canis]|uniref:Signal peptide-containing protein n=1 Tax=Cryptosporidium canis TaxID=195482 RepID=A0A9D5DFG6_9CRYT|nr:putative signal peptide-containing protein [Cryptosporidium canis]